ncbi:MIP family Ig-specific serine endopeptidase [Mycoplasmopsis verecunda]|uniref:Putative peptidase n=1 Tax=Mycoplasmopsis verecunda TaxID=171291 RepID=A0A1T4LZJ8_9BACT|nr:DUF31 family protein [Mycoplasmopsis verecunda]WPB54596.1 DUF31 family protein [Mycoplasmopsis verecunda]SJZ60170.1 Putative peptidase [Mycoplasmopsis verecunda]
MKNKLIKSIFITTAFSLLVISAVSCITNASERQKEIDINNAKKDLQQVLSTIQVTLKTSVDRLATFPSQIKENDLVIDGIDRNVYDIETSGTYNDTKLGLFAYDKTGRLIVKLAIYNKKFRNKVNTQKDFTINDLRKVGDIIPVPKPIPLPSPNPPVIQPNPKPKPPVNPQPPTHLPPAFPPFNIKDQILQNNQYPNYVSKYNKVDSNLLYQEIWNRTFSIRPGTLLNKNDENSLLVGQGTGWVLDYYKQDNNHYKLFIATNLHVIGNYANTNDTNIDILLNYNDPSGSVPGGFAIGKSNMPSSFGSIKNNEWDKFIQQNGGSVKYYANNQKYTSTAYSPYNSTQYTNAFSNPKIVFAAVDYMDDVVYNQFKDIINEKWQQYKQQKQQDLKTLNVDQDTRDKIEKFISQNPNKIPFYTDFGILELDVDLTKADETLKTWIKQAINAVDSYVTRIKGTSLLPNYTASNNNFLPTLDYLSKGRNLAQNNRTNEFGLSNAQNVYIAGYPMNNNKSTYWMQNNPTQRNSDEVLLEYNRRLGTANGIANNQLFDYPTNDVNSNIETGNIQIYSELWNKPFADFYGFNYTSKFSSLYYGASGSAVYNDFGQIVGIYNGVNANATFGNNMSSGTFAPLLQVGDVQALNNTIIYGYNLIDSTGFPHQTRSFKNNLKLFYPNGFDGKGNDKTAMFPEGFNK